MYFLSFEICIQLVSHTSLKISNLSQNLSQFHNNIGTTFIFYNFSGRSTVEMHSSRKNPYPPHGRSSEIPRGRGVLEAKILEAKYEAKLQFPGGRGGGGAKQKIPWGR